MYYVWEIENIINFVCCFIGSHLWPLRGHNKTHVFFLDLGLGQDTLAKTPGNMEEVGIVFISCSCSKL